MKLLIAFHNHQPVGNFGSVFEECFRKCYDPLLSELKDASDMKVAVHYSGPLLDWIEENEKKHIDTLASLVDQGTVEILGGGYYEPILSAIPAKSATRQLNRMKQFWKTRTGIEPRGIWLAERIWNPALIDLLAGEGVAFTILDDYHFYCASWNEKPIHGYFYTESNGSTLGIFPTDKELRYRIPFKEPHEVVNYLRDAENANPKLKDSCLMYGDDGEKFGIWPGTFDWAVKTRWLARFYEASRKEKDWLRLEHPSEITRHPPRQKIYLPPASYEEMTEWALPVEAQREIEAIKQDLAREGKKERYTPFVKGGIWENFLNKYRESDLMHKKMLHVFSKIEKHDDAKTADRAHDELLKSQCNCSYWHGLFGGVYLNYLRHANYTNMINAEKMLYKGPSLQISDYDCDGHEEILVETDNLSTIIKPSENASICQLDFKDRSFNLQNTFTRKPEAYHTKFTAAEDSQKNDGPVSPHETSGKINEEQKKHLAYDRKPRFSFIEHMIPETTSLEEMASNSFHDSLADFSVFELVENTKGSDRFSCRLRCGDIEKTIAVFHSEPSIHVRYENLDRLAGSGHWNDSHFGIELNLTMLAGNDSSRFFLVNGNKPEDPALQSSGTEENTKNITMVDESFGFSVSIDTSNTPCRFIRFPVMTVSQSEHGPEANYQNSSLFLLFHRNSVSNNTLEIRLNFDTF